MIHAIGYLGNIKFNFSRLTPGMSTYIRADGTYGNIDRPPKRLDGVFFGYLQRDGKTYLAVRAQFGNQDIYLENPILIESSRHTDGMGIGMQPTQFGDDSAQNLLSDMIDLNPSQSMELQWLARSVEFVGTASQKPEPPKATETASDIAGPAERELCTTYRILRDTAIALKVKQDQNYECQICGHTIELPIGSRYAEAHHIQPLGRPHEGPDIPGNVLCVCPNHHAELDYGVKSISLSDFHQVSTHQIDQKFIDYHNNLIFGQ
jgi:hypothetical protein